MTRAYCASLSPKNLIEIHNTLCHPGVTRLLHLKSKNLPFSTENVKKVSVFNMCWVETKVLPKAGATKLIKTMHPMDRLNIDFKGLLLSGRVIKITVGILIMWIALNKITLQLIYCFKQEIHWIGSQKRLIRSRFLSIPLNKIT